MVYIYCFYVRKYINYKLPIKPPMFLSNPKKLENVERIYSYLFCYKKPSSNPQPLLLCFTIYFLIWCENSSGKASILLAGSIKKSSHH